MVYKKMIKKCEHCGVDIVIERTKTGSGSGNVFSRKYCSIKCKTISNKNNPKDKIHKVCPICGKKFMKHKSGEWISCCSKECGYKLRHKKTMDKNRKTKKCVKCGKDFITYRNNKFCSLACSDSGHEFFSKTNRIPRYAERVEVKCAICNKPKQITWYQWGRNKYKRWYCSKECQNVAQSKGICPMHYNGRTGYRIDLNDGNYYKSSFEADYARYLNHIGVVFKYEPRTFRLKNRAYTPDFYIISEDKYIELKGYIKGYNNLKSVKKIKKQGINCEVIFMNNFYKMLEKQQLRHKIKNLEKYDYRVTKRLIIKHEHLMPIVSIDKEMYSGDVIDIEIDKQPNFYVTDKVENNWCITHNSKMPDIDTDFQTSKRQQVLSYLKKYGEENVVQIGSYGTYKVKNTFKAVAKIYGISVDDADKITKGMKMDQTDAILPTVQEIINILYPLSRDTPIGEKNIITNKIKELTPIYSDILLYTQKLEKNIKNFSQHAAGVLITDKPIYDYIPTVHLKDIVATGIDGDTLTKNKFVKMDILGLLALDVLDDCINMVKINENIDIDINKINIEDDNMMELFRNRDTHSIFQFDTPSMIKDGGKIYWDRETKEQKETPSGLLKSIQPDKFKHLVELNALNRPAPLRAGMGKLYEQRRFGAKYKTPKLVEKHLSDTYGLLIYQEQVMSIMVDWLGVTMGEADNIRREIEGKSLKDILNERNGYHILYSKYDKQDVEEAIDFVQNAAGYLFCLGHSLAYAYLAVQMMYFKCYYRKYFNVAVLNNESDDDKLKVILQDCKNNGWLKGYNLNELSYKFEIENNTGKIIPGVKILKGLGEKSIIEILKNKPYRSLDDFLIRAKPSKKILEVFQEAKIFKNTFGMDIDVNVLLSSSKKKKVQLEKLF